MTPRVIESVEDWFRYRPMGRFESPFDPSKCAAQVSDDTGWHFHQCSRSGSIILRNLSWYKQHAKKVGAAIDKEMEASR